MKKELNYKENNTLSLTDVTKIRLLDLAQELFCITDFRGKIKWINEAFAKLCGCKPEEAVNRDYFDLLTEQDRKSAQGIYSDLAAGKSIPPFVNGIISSTQETRKLQWTVTADYDQQLVFFTGIDITEKDFAGEELLITGHLSRLFFENDLTVVFEAALREICINEQWDYAEAWQQKQFTNVIERAASWSRDEEKLRNFDSSCSKITTIQGRGIIGKAWGLKEKYWSDNITNERNFLRKDLAREAGLNTMVSLPIINDEEVVAVFSFFSSARLPLSSINMPLLEAVTAQVSSFIHRKKIESELNKNQAILSEVEEITNSGSYEWDLINSRIFWTEGMFNVFGQEKKKYMDYEFIMHNCIPQEQRKTVDEFVQKAIKQQKPYSYEHDIICPEGIRKTVRVIGRFTIDEEGKAVKLFGTVNDITAQKEAELKLEKNQEYYRSLIENALDIKAILNRDGLFNFISPSIEKILGYKPKDLIGKNILRFVHPADITGVMRTFKQVVKTSEIVPMVEFRLKDAFGKWHDIESIMKNLIANPAVKGIVVNSRDISQRKEAENTIRSLLSISRKLTSTLNVDHLMDALVEEAIRLADAESGCAGLRSVHGLVCKKYFQNAIPLDYEFVWASGEGIPGRIMVTKLPYIMNDASEDPYILSEMRDRFNIRSGIYVPIFDPKNEVVGFLSVNNKNNDQKFTTSDRDKLIALTQSAAIAVQNAMTFQKAQFAEYKLNSSREHLRRLTAHNQSAREEERTRISREIHDELGQALTGLKMDLAQLESRTLATGIHDEAITERIKGMYNLINSTIQTVRKISSELRPSVLDYLGLSAAFEWQIQEFQNRTGIKCHLQTFHKEYKYDQELATVVFRIFQEALTNITRHAQATAVDVSLKEENEKLILRIRDNGRGITKSEINNTKSFGILGMRERASLIGGELTIKPFNKGGTIVSLLVPVGKHKEEKYA